MEDHMQGLPPSSPRVKPSSNGIALDEPSAASCSGRRSLEDLTTSMGLCVIQVRESVESLSIKVAERGAGDRSPPLLITEPRSNLDPTGSLFPKQALGFCDDHDKISTDNDKSYLESFQQEKHLGGRGSLNDENQLRTTLRTAEFSPEPELLPDPTKQTSEFLNATRDQEEELFKYMNKNAKSTSFQGNTNDSIRCGTEFGFMTNNLRQSPSLTNPTSNNGNGSVAVVKGVLQYRNYNMNNNTIKVRTKTPSKLQQSTVSKSTRKGPPKTLKDQTALVENAGSIEAIADPIYPTTNGQNCEVKKSLSAIDVETRAKKDPIIFRISKNSADRYNCHNNHYRM